MFLIWLLMQRLALGLPTVLQVRENYAILFHESGTSRFQLLDDSAPYLSLGSDDPSGRIWVLADQNKDLVDPSPAFRSGVPFFVVEAIYTLRHHLHWTNNFFSQSFCMATWSFSEVLQAYVTYPLGIHNSHAFTVAHSLGTCVTALVRNPNSGTYTQSTGHPPGH